MAVFFVCQGQTYNEERNGGYVWSPQLAKGGRRNRGYTTMRDIHEGDYIFHHSKGCVRAISIAKTDFYESDQPADLEDANTTVDWDKDGYRVDVEYHDLDVPLIIKDQEEWLKVHYDKDSAFQVGGKVKEQYMNPLSEEHAVYLLGVILPLQRDDDLKEWLADVRGDILGDMDSEYDAFEIEQINTIMEVVDDGDVPEWTGERKPQETTISNNTGKEKPKRNTETATDALKHARFRCEYNASDRTFLRKNGTPYTEPHHLIPISKYKDFNDSVDVMENIVSLCSHCHNLLHYGRLEDKKPILKKLYDERIDALRVCGLDLTFEQLLSYYK